MEIFVIGMLLLALAGAPFVLLILHLLARERLKKLERTLGEIGDRYEEQVAALESRLAELEDGGAPRRAQEPASATMPAEPAAATMPTEPTAAGTPAEPASAPTASPEPQASEPVDAPPTPSVPVAPPAEPPAPPVAAAPKPSRSSAEWEELIGGSWLNKVGAVVTVIGLAFALSYSMRYLGPAGRVALALACSAAMLAIGGLMEGRERYRVFARGLIGGGWAGLYFTTFAMHGLEAARIIESPLLGTVLLTAVAAGMVLHSLVYRSETVTGLAYFVTFGTLALVPATRFALFASLPAAASLIFVARRFRWSQMTVAGVVFTYGAYLARGGAPDVGPEDWVFGQALLFVYWFLFEAFDLLARRGSAERGVQESIMPLNAAGFVGASLLGWSAVRPESLWLFFVIATGMFVASAALRARQDGGLADGMQADGDRVRFDGAEVATLFAAVMLVFAIERSFDGWRQTVAWLLEAQLLVLSGLRLRSRFLRHLGSAVLLLPVADVCFDDLPSSATVTAFAHTWQRSTPLALLTAAALYVDRALLRRAAAARAAGLELLYNWAGTFLVAAVLATELPDVWIAPAWFVLGLCLAGFSLMRGAGELYLQGYALITLSWVVMVFGNVPTHDLVWGMPARWATALPMVVLLYGLAYRRRAVSGAGGDALLETSSREEKAAASRAGIDALAATLDRSAAPVLFAAATFLMSWFLLFEVAGRWLTVAWGLQGAALLATGFLLRARRVRFTGLALLGVCIAKLLLYDVAELEMIFRIFSFITLGALLLLVSFAYGRYREQIQRLL